MNICVRLKPNAREIGRRYATLWAVIPNEWHRHDRFVERVVSTIRSRKRNCERVVSTIRSQSEFEKRVILTTCSFFDMKKIKTPVLF